MNSILPTEMRGVMTISGYRGIGKSFLASQADAPENILFLDCESKAEGIHKQLNFGEYRALNQEVSGKKPIDLYNLTMEIINNIPQDRFTVAIIDNVSPLELALNAEGRRGAKQYAEEFGLNLKNIMAGRFGGTKAVANFLISSHICSMLHARGVKLIIATSHVSARWGSGGQIPNKKRIKGADKWQELSILSLVLVPSEHAPIPAALVQKEQLGLLEWNGTEHKVQRRLPVRIPKCTFAEIRRYLREPADLRNPAPGEVPSEEEKGPFDDRLSQEQIEIMKLALRKGEREEGGSNVLTAKARTKVSPDNAIRKRATVLRAQGVEDVVGQIARELGKAVPVVRAIVGE